MEHPGHLWNSIESALNRLAGRILPPAVLRWSWVLAHAGILCGAGFFLAITTGATSFCGADLITTYQSEPLYTATPDAVNPAHEGKLVKISGVITGDAMVCDPLTGVQVKGPFLTRTTTLTPDQEYSALSFDERCQIERQLVARTPWLPSNTIEPHFMRVTLTGRGKLGVFQIPRFGDHELYTYFKDRKTTQELTFTQAAPGLKARPLAPDSPHVILSTKDGEDLCCLQYYTGTTTAYIVARQFGNELDLSDPHAYFATYESELWTNRHHAKQRMMEGQEMGAVLTIALTAHFTLVILALSSLRSGVWHATAGRVNILRLPLLRISLLMGSFIILLGTGIIQIVASRHCEVSAMPGVAVLMVAAGLLFHIIRRWQFTESSGTRS